MKADIFDLMNLLNIERSTLNFVGVRQKKTKKIPRDIPGDFVKLYLIL